MEKATRGGYIVKRVFAFGIDWYITAIIANLISVIFNMLIFKENFPIQPNDVNNVIYYIISCLIATLFTYVYIPLKRTKNQTIMQRVLQIEVTDLRGDKLGIQDFLKRFFIGCLLIESAFYLLSSQITSFILFMYFPKSVQSIVSYILVGLSIASLVLALLDKKNTQTLHDRISNSRVIDIGFLEKGSKIL